VNAPVRFAYVNARMRAMKNDLWDAARFARFEAAPAFAGPAPTDSFDVLYPPLLRWYATLLEGCPPARTVLTAMFRRHEIENLKLLWRCTLRGRELPQRCWRPLAPLATLQPTRARTLGGLVEQLEGTPYAQLAAETWRSHQTDLAAAELAMDGWAFSALHDAAIALPDREAPARELVFSLLRERDLDLLRRACASYRLEPAFAPSLTTRLRREERGEGLRALAAWRPSNGPLSSILPPRLARLYGEVGDWDRLMAAVHRVRTAECRRTLMAWPFQIAPSLAALMLREDGQKCRMLNAEC
jgi:hypothetical protein